MYAISATQTRYREDEHGRIWVSERQVPTFYLDENVQGIVDEDHAVRIAEDILRPGNYSITAVKV